MSGCSCNPGEKTFWIYNVPICGGWIAPTENPDPSCWRHGSNEFTIPLSARYMKFAPIIEFSSCCITCGKFGLPAAGEPANRKRIMSAGIVLNLLAGILALVAAVGGMSTSGGALARLRWVYGKGTLPLGSSEIQINIYMGVKARYDIVDCSGSAEETLCQTTFSSMASFQDIGGSKYERFTEWQDEEACESFGEPETRELCNQCRESLFSETTLIMGILTQVPTISTNLQRGTLYGDVNCQKTMGVVSNIFVFASTMASLYSFRTNCYRDMPETVGRASMEWHMGVGFRCLAVATIVKLFDGLLHAIVPTPREKWTKPSQDISEVADYLALSVPKQQQMYLEESAVRNVEERSIEKSSTPTPAQPQVAYGEFGTQAAAKSIHVDEEAVVAQRQLDRNGPVSPRQPPEVWLRGAMQTTSPRS